MDQVGRRLPERHRVAVADGFEQRVGREILAHVSRLERQPDSGLPQHGVSLVAGGNPLGPRHHRSKCVLDARLRVGGRLERILVVRCRPLEGIGKPGETAGQGPDTAFVAAEQEPRRGQEVLVVVLLLDLGVGRVELVRRRGEKERGNGAAVMRLCLEQGLGELGGRTATVIPGLDQGLEPLELVQNDQIRLQGADADRRQQPPQFADQLVASPSRLVRPVVPVAMEPVIEEIAQLELQVVPPLELLIEIPPYCGLDGKFCIEPSTPAILLGDPALQEVHQGRAPLDVRSQKMKQDFPLPALAAGMAHLE